MILESLQAAFPDIPVRYWRDKAGREVDFVMVRNRDEIDVIECKWDPSSFDPAALMIFRGYYPKGRNYLLTPSGDPSFVKSFGGLEVRICTSSKLMTE